MEYHLKSLVNIKVRHFNFHLCSDGVVCRVSPIFVQQILFQQNHSLVWEIQTNPEILMQHSSPLIDLCSSLAIIKNLDPKLFKLFYRKLSWSDELIFVFAVIITLRSKLKTFTNWNSEKLLSELIILIVWEFVVQVNC